MTTETQLPVPQGGEVFLKCDTGHTLTGDKKVTCIQGSEFSFTDAPACEIGLISVARLIYLFHI